MNISQRYISVDTEFLKRNIGVNCLKKRGRGGIGLYDVYTKIDLSFEPIRTKAYIAITSIIFRSTESHTGSFINCIGEPLGKERIINIMCNRITPIDYCGRKEKILGSLVVSDVTGVDVRYFQNKQYHEMTEAGAGYLSLSFTDNIGDDVYINDKIEIHCTLCIEQRC